MYHISAFLQSNMNPARAVAVDTLYESTINQSWHSSLCFPKGWLLPKYTPFESLDITPTLDADLFGLTNVAMAGYVFRFNPSNYPVTDTIKGKGFKNLMAQLMPKGTSWPIMVVKIPVSFFDVSSTSSQ
jgi:hypothetical protein